MNAGLFNSNNNRYAHIIINQFGKNKIQFEDRHMIRTENGDSSM